MCVCVCCVCSVCVCVVCVLCVCVCVVCVLCVCVLCVCVCVCLQLNAQILFMVKCEKFFVIVAQGIVSVIIA